MPVTGKAAQEFRWLWYGYTAPQSIVKKNNTQNRPGALLNALPSIRTAINESLWKAALLTYAHQRDEVSKFDQ